MLGKPDTFELLGNLCARSEEGGDEGAVVQIDGKYGSYEKDAGEKPRLQF